ncbi:MAG: ATP-dependent DNA helicase RecQ [Bacteroidetes bacterium MedPE-SWsnd-G2]|nr:MAG: ATP-dependent DNA helicase RecQ [Bacteroidetes bacterium MedPE-SWsnd-G2]
MTDNYSKETLLKTLKSQFGYDAFRGQQEVIINNVLERKDSLVIMPTGGGKSICFQLPSLFLKGVTLVISPLIALMKDQVDGLKSNGIAAAFLNSSQSSEEHNLILEKISKHELQLIYVAPESLAFLQPVMSEEYISLIAIDEAHCISSWGHDFRPAYQQLGFLKSSLPHTPIIALTATADKATRLDILKQLKIESAKTFISSFDRKNIQLDVRLANNRVEQIFQFLDNHEDESGIIYCLSRKTTEQIATKLKAKGISAMSYHAGLSFDERNRAQEDFIHDKIQVVCATIAFGMGIDKSNVRWIIHYNMPKNIEGYYQEIGRSGRDGLKAHALMFHSYADVIQLKKFASGSSNEAVQLAKLDRIKQFSEATSCRRRVLLGYFGEELKEDCGNCDVCKHPPIFFDGTIIAQKFLSAVTRLKESEPLGVVVDVLRGAQNANVLNNNYQVLKCYGIGKDISWVHWQQYAVQVLNQGYCEIAFHENNALRLTNMAKEVLFNGKKVLLTEAKDRTTASPKTPKPKQKTAKSTGLFERLKKVRYTIALEEGIPAYLVFNDATLKEIERVRPESDEEFLSISGVGQRKLEVYGDEFLEEVRSFVRSKPKKVKKTETHIETYNLYQQGLSIDEISIQRKLKPTTIYSHIAKLYSDGKKININDFVSNSEIEAVKRAKSELDKPNSLKPYFEYLNEEVDYFKIRLALSVIDKNS